MAQSPRPFFSVNGVALEQDRGVTINGVAYRVYEFQKHEFPFEGNLVLTLKLRESGPREEEADDPVVVEIPGGEEGGHR